jgi:2-polyprenyl-3-methyl-5-hydroxy-6-metoxy-1,4-benzoquinol methylase
MEIKQKIASFEGWHYQFDLNGNLTPIRKSNRVNRHEQRKKYFFDPLVQLFGGSLRGKRVLDLACNAGFWSLCAAEAGCDYVLGIDGRQMHVDQANFVFEVKEVEKDRYDFVAGDIFETDLRQFGTLDVVLCLGLMYHISKHMELMEKISEVNDDVLVIDTTLSMAQGSFLEVQRQSPASFMAAVDYPLAMKPTRQTVRDLVRAFGYSVVTLEPDFRNADGEPDWSGGGDFHKGARRAFICAKKTDLSHLAVETEPIEHPKAQRPKAQQRPGPTGADRAKPLLRRTDRLLSQLFISRRWKLATALSAALQVLRGTRSPLPEDKLRELKGELRTLLRQSERASSGRRSKRASRTN